jgi:hypothetical protein
MNVLNNLMTRGIYSTIPMILLWLFCPGAVRAQSLFVDCTGGNPFAYQSINAALPDATPGTFILVTGPCTENVYLYGQNNLNLGAFYGQTATINGSITINNSQNVFLYGLNVTSQGGDGISISSSRGISLNVCSSSGNAGVGLRVGGMSDVTIGASGTYDNNARGGMNITGNSLVALVAWAGPVDISNNGGAGVFVSQANFSTLGSTTIANNTFGGEFNPGLGLDLRGGAHAQMGAYFSPNVISGNQSGGASLQETSEISFWSIEQPNLIQGNGPVGVLVGQGSQVTFADVSGPLGAQITDHTSAGVDLYANSQAYFIGSNQILRNGSLTNPQSAGIRVDGNSQALLRGGQVAQNYGPGILALVNSSVDFAGVSFSGNAQGGIITCDSSSVMISDLTQPNNNPPGGVQCKTPHSLSHRQISKMLLAAPDWSAHKAVFDKYEKSATKKH